MATRLPRGRVFLGLLAIMALGCSDGGDDGSGSGPVAASEFVAAAAVAECDDFGDCCAQDGHPFEQQRCRSQVTTVLQARLASDAIVYDAEAAGRCVQALRASPGQCQTTSDELQSCVAVFRGTTPIGGACTEGQECAGWADGVFCYDEAGTGQAVCIAPQPPPIRAGRGEACSGTCRPDDQGRGCGDYGPDPVPVCFTADGLYCAGATRTCQPLLAAGAACERMPEFPGCVEGTFCERERCVPVRGEGESCVVDLCTEGLTCPTPNQIACAPSLTCTFGSPEPRCLAPQPDGNACTSFTECASRWCERDCTGGTCSDSGVCGPPKRTSRESCSGDLGDAEAAQSLLPPAAWRERAAAARRDQ